MAKQPEKHSDPILQSTSSPLAGELMVMAEDGGTLRIVVVDELNIRLDIDYEGDSIVDTTITTTWANLQ